MDFTTFSQILQKVLIKNKSVIVPSIGCFVLEELNSEIQFDGKILTPPQKSLFFCTSETESNGELEKELSVINGYDIEQASKVLNSTVNEIRNQLDIKGEILLEGFGTISKGQGGDLYFYPHKDERFFIANLPLEPISVKPVELKDDNANDISIALDLDVDEPIANFPMQPVLISETSCDVNDEYLTLDVISGSFDSAE